MKQLLIYFLILIAPFTFISCLSIDDAVDQKQFRDGCITAAQKTMSESEAERYCNCALELVYDYQIDEEFGSFYEAETYLDNMSDNELTEFLQPCR